MIRVRVSVSLTVEPVDERRVLHRECVTYIDMDEKLDPETFRKVLAQTYGTLIACPGRREIEEVIRV